MKRTIALLILTAILIMFCSCTGQHESASSHMEVWLRNARLDAEETPQELYQKALAEDTLVIYSSSTRIMDVKDSFEKQYPGLTVSVQDTRSVDLVDILEQNFNEGDYNCDIMVCSDSNGEISQNLVPAGIVYKYTPYDIADKIRPENDPVTLPLVGEIELAFFNTEVYDSAPINNW